MICEHRNVKRPRFSGVIRCLDCGRSLEVDDLYEELQALRATQLTPAMFGEIADLLDRAGFGASDDPNVLEILGAVDRAAGRNTK